MSVKAIWFPSWFRRDKPRYISIAPNLSVQELLEVLTEGQHNGGMAAFIDQNHVLFFDDQLACDKRNLCTEACGWPVDIYGDVYIVHIGERGLIVDCEARHWNPFDGFDDFYILQQSLNSAELLKMLDTLYLHNCLSDEMVDEIFHQE